MLCSPPLFLEYEDVLKRPEQQSVHGLRASQVDEFLSGMASVIQPVEIHFQWRPQVNDANDEMVLEAAINGYADAIVTNNRKDFVRAAKRFSIDVVSPEQMLRKVRA
jgi:putative PIN family toxin of toxin-antitoxin system